VFCHELPHEIGRYRCVLSRASTWDR
jgi:hypothetical protein